MKTIYTNPIIKVACVPVNNVLCQSVGGNTGYDPDHFVEGGGLVDDED